MGKNTKSKEGWRLVTGVMMSAVALFCIGGCAAEFNYLITPWWIPVVIVLAISVPLALPMRGLWQWLTGKQNVALNMICHLVFTFPLLLCTALTVNLLTADKNPVNTKAVVEKVYTETRYHTKRVSRKVYTRGAPYTVYCVEIQFPEGKKRHFDIKKKVYNRLSKGDTVSVDIKKGALGMRMFNGSEMHLPETATPEHKKETRHQRMRRKYKEHMEKIRNIHNHEGQQSQNANN